MASIETRSGRSGTSFRVIWRVREGRKWVKKAVSFPDEAGARQYKSLIESMDGDKAAADRVIIAHASEAPLLSTVAAEHILRLIDVTPYTRTKYQTHIDHHFKHLDMPIDRITEDDIARWVSWMFNDAPVRGKTDPGYAQKTISNAHSFLSAVLAYAVKRGYCPKNVAGDTRLPTPAHREGGEKFLSVEEISALMPHFAPKYQTYARFLFATGLRAGEFLALKPEDFTIADGTVYVRILRAMKQASGGVGVYEGPPKTKTSRRTIDVDAATMELVWPLVRAAGHGNYVFPAGTTQATTRLRQNMVEGAQSRASAAGFSKHFGLHTFRHSHAAHLLANGVPMHEVSWRLGHSSIQVTIDLYGHLTTQRMGAISKVFGESTQLLSRTAAPRALEPA